MKPIPLDKIVNVNVSRPARRVEMECPPMIGMPNKVLVDGMRVPATKSGFALLREAIYHDRLNGLEPPADISDFE